MTFPLGSTVYLKSGSPPMTVSGFTPAGTTGGICRPAVIAVLWHAKGDGEAIVHDGYPEACLTDTDPARDVPVEQVSGPPDITEAELSVLLARLVNINGRYRDDLGGILARALFDRGMTIRKVAKQHTTGTEMWRRYEQEVTDLASKPGFLAEVPAAPNADDVAHPPTDYVATARVTTPPPSAQERASAQAAAQSCLVKHADYVGKCPHCGTRLPSTKDRASMALAAANGRQTRWTHGGGIEFLWDDGLWHHRAAPVASAKLIDPGTRPMTIAEISERNRCNLHFGDGLPLDRLVTDTPVLTAADIRAMAIAGRTEERRTPSHYELRAPIDVTGTVLDPCPAFVPAAPIASTDPAPLADASTKESETPPQGTATDQPSYTFEPIRGQFDG